MTGHLLGAGAIEGIVCVKAIEEDLFLNHWIRKPDPECDLDYVPNVGRKQEIHYALSNSLDLEDIMPHYCLKICGLKEVPMDYSNRQLMKAMNETGDPS